MVIVVNLFTFLFRYVELGFFKFLLETRGPGLFNLEASTNPVRKQSQITVDNSKVDYEQRQVLKTEH